MASSRVPLNIAANVVAQAAGIVFGLICTPFYIRLLGIEAYGLMAFYLVVLAAIQMLDLGLGATVNREVARLSGGAKDGNLPSVVVTFERWYWMLAIAIGFMLFVGLPALTTWWIRSQALSADEIDSSAKIFAAIALLQWATSFYGLALMGLQKQVALNAVQVPFAAIASLGGLLFIWLGPRSLSALLAWQAGTALCQAVVIYCYFWSTASFKRTEARVQFELLRRRWRFSMGMTGISTTGLIITHLDKWILSRLLALEAFAHYSLAVTVSRALYVLITPVFNTYFPRLSSLVATNDPISIRACYHTASQLMAVLILPLAGVLALFSQEILQLWLHDAALAAAVAPIASILIVGTSLNGLMNIPFAMQLAQGNTRIGLLTNVFLVIVLIPSIAWATVHYGAVGGASMWAAANAMYLLIGIPVTHFYVIRGDLGVWLLQDLLPPTMAAFAVVSAARWFVAIPENRAAVVVILAAVWLAATAAAFLSSAHMRAKLRTHLHGDASVR